LAHPADRQRLRRATVARRDVIDCLHLEHPFAGSRLLKKLLRREGIEVGRKHIATLRRRMGIDALYRKKNTSKRHPEHVICSISPASR
jgi:putative transposase